MELLEERLPDIGEARQLLAQMGVRLTLRQMQRAAEQDAQGRRKLPFFVDPIERKLKIEKNDLISIYFRRQVEAQRNLSQNKRKPQ
jgi:hypothetical protein